MHIRSYIIGHETHPHGHRDSTIHHLRTVFSSKEQFRKSAYMFRILSDPTRYQIYMCLQEVEELAVSDIALIIGATQSATSHALSVLSEAGFILKRRCGQLMCYSLNPQMKMNENEHFIFHRAMMAGMPRYVRYISYFCSGMWYRRLSTFFRIERR